MAKKQYECNICGYKGSTREEMREHIGNKHGDRLKTNNVNTSLSHRIKPILYILSYLVMVWISVGLGIAQILYAPFVALGYLGSAQQGTPLQTLIYTLVLVSLALFIYGWYIIIKERAKKR